MNGTSSDMMFTEATMERSASSVDLGVITMVSLMGSLSAAIAFVVARRSRATHGTEPLLSESAPQDDA